MDIKELNERLATRGKHISVEITADIVRQVSEEHGLKSEPEPAAGAESEEL